MAEDEKDKLLEGTVITFPLPNLRNGKDEMNLAEFPFCSLSRQVPKVGKDAALVFEDTITTPSGKPQRRRLEVTGCPVRGLPRAADEEVIVGLLQFSAASKFNDREVRFNRSQLIEILGWPDNGQSYQRIKDALRRFLGVTFYYEKSWWDKDEKRWVEDGFHLIERVTLCDADEVRGRRSGQESFPFSRIVWSEVLFRSFGAGYVKRLDIELYRSLKSPTAKRMYRFLDKHFYRSPRLEFSLVEFAYNKIGLSRGYRDTSQIKRKLEKGIAELEEHGFIEKLSRERRFPGKRGHWTVVFTKAIAATRGDDIGEREPMDDSAIEQLVLRDVDPLRAADILANSSLDVVERTVEQFDFLKRKGQTPKNPGGWIAAGIERGGYKDPNGFETRKEMALQASERKIAQEKEKIEQAKKQAEDKRLFKERSKEANDYLAGLSDAARNEVVREAYARNVIVKDRSVSDWKSSYMTRCVVESYVLEIIKSENKNQAMGG